jgi:hypothetical protein
LGGGSVFWHSSCLEIAVFMFTSIFFNPHILCHRCYYTRCAKNCQAGICFFSHIFFIMKLADTSRLVWADRAGKHGRHGRRHGLSLTITISTARTGFISPCLFARFVFSEIVRQGPLAM